jgi:putative acetyltransferase
MSLPDEADLSLVVSDPYCPEAVALFQALWDEIEPLYIENAGPCQLLSADVAGPGAVLILAWQNGQAVGSGAIRPLEPGIADIAEVKRVYVAPHARGQGIARRILVELEAQARRLGYVRVHLETGTLQPDAVRLYEQAGYERIPGFGKYIDDPRSVYFGKSLS